MYIRQVHHTHKYAISQANLDRELVGWQRKDMPENTENTVRSRMRPRLHGRIGGWKRDVLAVAVLLDVLVAAWALPAHDDVDDVCKGLRAVCSRLCVPLYALSYAHVFSVACARLIVLVFWTYSSTDSSTDAIAQLVPSRIVNPSVWLLFCGMGWLRLVGSLKFKVFFAKEPWKRDDILQKRHVILRSLLTVATPCVISKKTNLYVSFAKWCVACMRVFLWGACVEVQQQKKTKSNQTIFVPCTAKTRPQSKYLRTSMCPAVAREFLNHLCIVFSSDPYPWFADTPNDTFISLSHIPWPLLPKNLLNARVYLEFFFGQKAQLTQLRGLTRWFQKTKIQKRALCRHKRALYLY